jgi:hypothetical protein
MIRNAYKYYSENLKGTGHSEDVRCNCENTVKMDVKETGCKDVD